MNDKVPKQAIRNKISFKDIHVFGKTVERQGILDSGQPGGGGVCNMNINKGKPH